MLTASGKKIPSRGRSASKQDHHIRIPFVLFGLNDLFDSSGMEISGTVSIYIYGYGKVSFRKKMAVKYRSLKGNGQIFFPKANFATYKCNV